MGYKRAGYRVLGGVEIDPKMMEIYRKNHNPEFSYLMGVEEFNKKEDIPPVLFNVDILDGSPPCSSFSMAGPRERDWGKKKKFREGQADQILDDLFFHFIDVAKKLYPKVVVAENVKGLIMGNARGYVKEIFAKFREAGYETQLFLLNASRMGVPQSRERTFFIARRKDLMIPSLKLEFNEDPISVRSAFKDCMDERGKDFRSSVNYKYFKGTPMGKSFSYSHPKGSLFSLIRLDPDKPSPTLTATNASSTLYHWDDMFGLSRNQVCELQTFPLDYNFLDEDPGYVCGMSVPPKMMERLSLKIAEALASRPPVLIRNPIS